jgi:siroheme synthase-like protein
MAHLFYPIYLDLRGRNCLVVGGGNVAVGKVRGLIEADARVTVVAPEVDPQISQWHAAGKLTWRAREFLPGDIDGQFLVIAATDDGELNASIYRLADRQLRVANAVDDLDNCNFIAPAIARAGAIQVAVSTSGKSPALAKRIRDGISREWLTPDAAALADFLGHWRPAVKDALPTYRQRKEFWEGVLASDVPQLLANDQLEEAQRAMHELIEKAQRGGRPHCHVERSETSLLELT